MNRVEKRAGLRGWLDRRYQLSPLLEFLQHKEVPLGSHWMGWYYLGGVTMFFFIVQVVTGVLLLMYYQPGEATAYESIRFLTTKVPFGWLIRSVHSWSAHLMIISLVLHMFSTMMLKAYRPPREITWVSGFFLFALTMGFGFSGYLLPWNKLAYFATTVGTNIVSSIPLLGDWLLQVLRGGHDDWHAAFRRDDSRRKGDRSLHVLSATARPSRFLCRACSCRGRFLARFL